MAIQLLKYLEMTDMKNMIAKIVTVAAFASSGAVFAQDAESALAKGGCKKDVKAYCAGLKPGDGQIQSCLNANADKLSETCKADMAKAGVSTMSPANPAQAPAAEPQPMPPKK